MDHAERAAFAFAAKKMCDMHSDIHLHSITVRKEHVGTHIRKDGNKLYNYMIGLSLLDRMAECERVTMVPDPRSIKVKSGNSLHDYLQVNLWFVKNVATELVTLPTDSKNCLALQCADMLAGVVQSRFEFNELDNFKVIQSKLRTKCLFF